MAVTSWQKSNKLVDYKFNKGHFALQIHAMMRATTPPNLSNLTR